MKAWLGSCLAIAVAGFAGAWICLRLLLLPVLLVGISGCGTMGATILLSGIAGSAGGAAMGALVARSVASSETTRRLKAMPSDAEWRRAFGSMAKPEPWEWRDLDAADEAARKAVRP